MSNHKVVHLILYQVNNVLENRNEIFMPLVRTYKNEPVSETKRVRVSGRAMIRVFLYADKPNIARPKHDLTPREFDKSISKRYYASWAEVPEELKEKMRHSSVAQELTFNQM